MERLISFDAQWVHDLVITGINIFILFFALSYFLFNPAREVLEKRRRKIADDLEAAKGGKAEAFALKEEYERQLGLAEKEAEEILNGARREAQKQGAEILADARREAGRVLDRARREIDLEKEKALADMRQEVVSLASQMAGKAIGAALDGTSGDALIDEALKEMGESTWQS